MRSVGTSLRPEEGLEADLCVHLDEILRDRCLVPVFQPIVDLRMGGVLGYEGLIRGPADSPLSLPANLFRVAAHNERRTELEVLCCHTLLERFASLGLPGRLFLNISPQALPHLAVNPAALVAQLQQHALTPTQLVFELTEHPAHDPTSIYALLDAYRKAGIQVALDDLGDGHSSLRRWREARPDYVKVDMYFVQNIHLDSIKQQFLRSLRDIARGSGAIIIAEGIERQEELEFLASIDIRAGQGYYLGRPCSAPQSRLDDALCAELRRYKHQRHAGLPPEAYSVVNAGSLLRTVPCVSPGMSNDDVCALFDAHPELQSIPVVDRTKPIGMILRDDLIGRFAKPYQRELYGRRSCTLFMDAKPPMADQGASLQQLSHILIEADRSRLINDFIITVDGRYLGIGTSYDLLRELTQVQITAARHANPLTQLPGNVPVNLQIENLLAEKVAFSACYADLDNFKPFNDTFGYVRGDEIIQLTGRLLTDYARSDDFVGHIGGDDFLVLWRSTDWEARCQALLRAFDAAMRAYLLDRGLMKDVAHDGYFARDRLGKQRYFTWPSISLGVVKVCPGQYETYDQIGAAAAEAKAQAKTVSGNSLHIAHGDKLAANPSQAWVIH